MPGDSVALIDVAKHSKLKNKKTSVLGSTAQVLAKGWHTHRTFLSPCRIYITKAKGFQRFKVPAGHRHANTIDCVSFKHVRCMFENENALGLIQDTDSSSSL